MNRKTLLSGLVALALVAVSSLQAAGNGFVRPTIAFVSPDAEGYDDALYAGADVGAFLGKNRNHEISGEIGGVAWEYKENFGALRGEGEETYVPFLANYRYYVGTPDVNKVRFYFGPSLGFTSATYEAKVWGPGFYRADEASEVLFTFAANVGVEVKINERLSLNIGYRYLHIDGTETELFGSNIDLDDSKAHIGSVGLTVRF